MTCNLILHEVVRSSSQTPECTQDVDVIIPVASSALPDVDRNRMWCNTGSNVDDREECRKHKVVNRK